MLGKSYVRVVETYGTLATLQAESSTPRDVQVAAGVSPIPSPSTVMFAILGKTLSHDLYFCPSHSPRFTRSFLRTAIDCDGSPPHLTASHR